MLLGRWVIANAEVFKGCSVLELGSGCGLAGLAAACCTGTASVCLSDFAAATVANLALNVGANCEAAGSAVEAAGDPPVATGAGAALHAASEFVSRRRGGSCGVDGSGGGAPCLVRVARVNWDDEETWPEPACGGDERKGEAEDACTPECSGSGDAPSPPPPRRLFDAVLAADVLYRRSYARKVAAVVRGVLRPGGILVSVSPAAREGLGLLRRLLTEAGASAADIEVPDAWRGNPLRTPTPAGEGATPPDAAPGAAAPPPSLVTLVSDAAARGLFPELAVSSYEMTCVVFTMPPAAPPAC